MVASAALATCWTSPATAYLSRLSGSWPSPPEARTHNQLLSRAEIEGLDQNCAVGLGGMFYTKRPEGHTVVATWLGEEVSRHVQVRGNILTFTRKGMTFRGRLRRDQDCFCFRLIQ